VRLDETDHETIDALLAGYVLGGLTGEDATLADRLLTDHVPSCPTCRETLSAFRGVTADLALSVDPITPPETLLPRLHRELDPRAVRRRPIALAVAAGVVAVVGLAGLTVSQGMRASNANATAEDLRAAAEIALRPDADLVPVGPVHEVSAPGMTEFYVIGTACPEPPDGSVYRLWLVADGRATFVTDFVPDDGNVVLSVPFDPSRYDDVWVSVEPAGSEPTAPSDDRWQASGATAA
jgi:anti-sigma-K factor RskA